MEQAGNYSYSAAPAPAAVKTTAARQKYRDDGENAGGDALNLMSDPRVVRGSTYAAKVVTATNKADLAKRNRPLPRRKVGTRRSSTPPPVDGRAHMDIQTDDVLEELTDRPIELDAETQTPAMADRPPSPLFVKARIGHDAETQIMSGDLFNFDLEVEPILEVLVGKNMHTALLELMQEDELSAIRLQQEEFEGIRNVELAEVQRLEAESRRRGQEKERRLAQERARLAAKRALEEKIAARSFSSSYLGSMHTNVFDTLIREGFFYDPLRKEVEDIFMLGVVNTVKEKADAYKAAEEIGLELLESARTYARNFGEEAVMLRRLLAERLAREAALRAAQEAEAKRLAEEAARAAEAAEGEAPPE
jgi:hypothetical protein